jgi:hypothetical protein
MSEAELRRLRRDLDVMEQAAGLRLPFGWTDVWLALALVPCGAALSAWGAFGPAEYRALGLLPALGVFLVAVVRAARRSRVLTERRERVFATVSVLVAAAGLAVLIVWEKKLGLPSRAVRGAGLALLGVMLVPLALSSRGRRSLLAGAAALIPFGLALPLCSAAQVVVVGGLAMMLAGLLAGAIQAGQLRAEGRGHERPAD